MHATTLHSQNTMFTPAWMSQLPLPAMTTRRWRYALSVGLLIPCLVVVLDAAAVFSEK